MGDLGGFRRPGRMLVKVTRNVASSSRLRRVCPYAARFRAMKDSSVGSKRHGAAAENVLWLEIVVGGKCEAWGGIRGRERLAMSLGITMAPG